VSELDERARQVIDTNRYMTLGTAEPDGRPRLSPVWFTHSGYQEFWWVSSPDAHHSVNLAARPGVALVVFDSTAAVGEGRAVYVTADAAEIPSSELAGACTVAFASVAKDGIAFTPVELSGDADLRLYRARATAHEIHVPGRDPDHGAGIDRRVPVRP
jgi:hypothetical protein